MNTHNVYFANLFISTKVFQKKILPETDEVLVDYKTHSKFLKRVLVLCKNDLLGEIEAVDLNDSNNVYFSEIPTREGMIFLKPESFQSFNKVTGNRKTHLTKRRIRKIGNKELYK